LFHLWRDRHVIKLFDCHFCSNRLHLRLPPSHIGIYHTFDVVLMLLLKQHAILLTHINLVIVHVETNQNLFGLVYIFRHVMLRRDEINNQFDDIVVAMSREVVL
jgi:hypothetical protein